MTTITATDLDQRARKGAALLDDRHPGWRDRIDPATLDMEDTERDVLGQLYGNFHDGLTALGLRTNLDAAEHGFTLLVDYEPPDWWTLTAAWTEAAR